MNGFGFTPKAATRTLAKASSKSTCIKWQNQTEQDILDAKKCRFTIVVQDEFIFTCDSKTEKNTGLDPARKSTSKVPDITQE